MPVNRRLKTMFARDCDDLGFNIAKFRRFTFSSAFPYRTVFGIWSSG
jgi:hypothetical protein